jgi:hypothetical protein
MIEKIGSVKNPLTIIAIFAGIAEVSGTGVLPFVSSSNQIYFIYFLIIFPLSLVILFFLTLNFNHKVLYAPSDFQDESNFIKILAYDQSTQEKVQVNVNKSEFFGRLNYLATQYEMINSRINEMQNVQTSLKDSSEQFIGLDSETISKSIYRVEISNIKNKGFALVNILKEKGFTANIYKEYWEQFGEEKLNKPSENESIWLGKNVPVNIAIEVIKSAKQIYPFLKYIDLYGHHGTKIPEGWHNEIFIGGSTSIALEDKLKELKNPDFEKLYSITSKSDLHDFIRSFYCGK